MIFNTIFSKFVVSTRTNWILTSGEWWWWRAEVVYQETDSIILYYSIIALRWFIIYLRLLFLKACQKENNSNLCNVYLAGIFMLATLSKTIWNLNMSYVPLTFTALKIQCIHVTLSLNIYIDTRTDTHHHCLFLFHVHSNSKEKGKWSFWLHKTAPYIRKLS